MNKKVSKLFVFFCVLFSNINVFAMNKGLVLADCSIISPSLQNFLNYIYSGLRIATPILVVLLVSMDMFKAATSGKDDEIKKATSAAIKRIIIGVVIMFIPTILNFLFNSLIPGITGTCNIG